MSKYDKSTEEYGDKIAEKAKAEAANVYPTRFDTNIIFKSITERTSKGTTITRYVRVKEVNETADAIFTNELLNKFYLLSHSSLIIIGYIGKHLQYHSNIIVLKEKDVCEETKISRNSFYKALDELITNFVIDPTTRKSKYIINHNYIYKGNLFGFINMYNDKHPNGATIINNKVKIE